MDIEKRRQLRDTFGAFMTGVTVVTTLDENGNPLGFTANSFSSVSLDPPLLQISIDKRSANLDYFTKNPNFAVNILSARQKDVSNIFASKDENRFSRIGWELSANHSPLINYVSAWFDCGLYQVVDAGDHMIILGEILGFDSEGTPGLGYYRGTYFTPVSEAESMTAPSSTRVSALINTGDKLLMVTDPEQGYRLPEVAVEHQGVSQALHTLMRNLPLPASPGFIYSMYEDRLRHQHHIVFLCSLPLEQGAEHPVINSTEWVSLSDIPALPVGDRALKALITRFAREHIGGNYSLYFGTEMDGEINQFAAELNQEKMS